MCSGSCQLSFRTEVLRWRDFSPLVDSKIRYRFSDDIPTDMPSTRESLSSLLSPKDVCHRHISHHSLCVVSNLHSKWRKSAGQGRTLSSSSKSVVKENRQKSRDWKTRLRTDDDSDITTWVTRETKSHTKQTFKCSATAAKEEVRCWEKSPCLRRHSLYQRIAEKLHYTSSDWTTVFEQRLRRWWCRILIHDQKLLLRSFYPQSSSSSCQVHGRDFSLWSRLQETSRVLTVIWLFFARGEEMEKGDAVEGKHIFSLAAH